MNYTTHAATEPKPIAAYLGNIIPQPAKPATPPKITEAIEPPQIKSMTLNADRARFTFTNGRQITAKYTQLDNPTREVMLSFLLATLKTVAATMPTARP